jgi:hypothetical protein
MLHLTHNGWPSLTVSHFSSRSIDFIIGLSTDCLLPHTILLIRDSGIQNEVLHENPWSFGSAVFSYIGLKTNSTLPSLVFTLSCGDCKVVSCLMQTASRATCTDPDITTFPCKPSFCLLNRFVRHVYVSCVHESVLICYQICKSCYFALMRHIIKT